MECHTVAMTNLTFDETKRAGEAAPLQTLGDAIAEHPFARGLRPEYLNVLADCAMPVRFESGDVIAREGEVANRFYLIQEGEITLEVDRPDREPIPIETVRAGEVLGWSWFFLPYHWHFTARATAPTRAIFFYGTRLREQCEKDHDLGFELAKRVSQVLMQRLGATMRQLVEHD